MKKARKYVWIDVYELMAKNQDKRCRNYVTGVKVRQNEFHVYSKKCVRYYEYYICPVRIQEINQL